MKLMITGSRKATGPEHKAALKAAIEKHGKGATLILHGGAKGADTLAEELAQEMGLPTEVIKPDYQNHHYKAAPLKRNTLLVAKADKVIAYYIGTKRGGTLDAATKAADQDKLQAEYLNGKELTTPPKQLQLL
ncbi:MAG: SLOG family protein [Bacteroidota bacterium]